MQLFKPNCTTTCQNSQRNSFDATLTSRTETAPATKCWPKWRNKWPVTKKKLKTCRKWRRIWQWKIIRSLLMISISCMIIIRCINIWARSLRSNFRRAIIVKGRSLSCWRKRKSLEIRLSSWKMNTINYMNKVKPILI